MTIWLSFLSVMQMLWSGLSLKTSWAWEKMGLVQGFRTQRKELKSQKESQRGIDLFPVAENGAKEQNSRIVRSQAYKKTKWEEEKDGIHIGEWT